MSLRPTRPHDPFVLRRVAAMLAGASVIAAGAVLGAAGSATVTSPTARDLQPPAPPTSLTEARNAACSAGRRFQAVSRGLGPFCTPPDSIRAIDDPSFSTASRVSFLDPGEPVIAVEAGGEARAYPVRVLVWHEIANDEVGGVPLAVTFCPLCNSPVTFDRRVEGRELTFGVSGRLIRGNLVMFDRETETLWQQLTGEALRGEYEGERLSLVPSRMIPFEDFRQAFPDGLVMTTETGLDAAYGEDPYAGYGVDPEQPSSFQFGSEADPRLPPKERVLGIISGNESAAVVFPEGRGERRVVETSVGGRDVVVLLTYGAGQPATTGSFGSQTPGWAGSAFLQDADGQPVSLRAGPEGFVDRETGTVFNVSGEAIRGSLAGSSLKPVPSLDSFWFAWSFFYPETTVVFSD